MESNYQIGDIIVGAITGALAVVTRLDSRYAYASVIRPAYTNTERSPVGRILKPELRYKMRKFEGELTDEEEALAMKYILLGGANNA